MSRPEECMCGAGFGPEACPVHSLEGLQAAVEYQQRQALDYDPADYDQFDDS
jgi:hypothetical protein